MEVPGRNLGRLLESYVTAGTSFKNCSGNNTIPPVFGVVRVVTVFKLV
jgi:hypothetical protein